jgi:hypothetical protein
MKTQLLILMMISCSSMLMCQGTWITTFSGTGEDEGVGLICTREGTYVVLGNVGSQDGDYKELREGRTFEKDIILTELNNRGEAVWMRVHGASHWDQATSIVATSDGGYIFTGSSYYNTDVKGQYKGESDVIVIKTNREGWVQWTTIIGGTRQDDGYSIVESNDGGFFVTGLTESDDGDFRGLYKGLTDVIVTKLDQQGDVQWTRSYGGSSADYSKAIVATPDGGAIIAALGASKDGDFPAKQSDGRIVVFKIDDEGNLEWAKFHGGSSRDVVNMIAVTPLGEYALVGTTSSNDGDFAESYRGGLDIFVILLDQRGDMRMCTALGGSGNEKGASIAVTSSGELIVAGETSSNDGDFEGMNKGSNDIFILKLNNRGDVQWSRLYGGSRDDLGRAVSVTPDGNIMITGSTRSKDGDFTAVRNLFDDLVVMKLDANGNLNPSTSTGDDIQPRMTLSVTPNPLSLNSSVSYCVDHPSHVRIDAINSLGEVVAVLVDQFKEAETYRVAINTGILVSGAYTLRMTSNSGIATTSVLAVH